MSQSRLFRLSLIFACMAGALALAGCGRKGPLELPPASLAEPGAATAQPASGSPLGGAFMGATETPLVADPSFSADGKPIAGRSSKKTFVLDPLID